MSSPKLIVELTEIIAGDADRLTLGTYVGTPLVTPAEALARIVG